MMGLSVGVSGHWAEREQQRSVLRGTPDSTQGCHEAMTWTEAQASHLPDTEDPTG